MKRPSERMGLCWRCDHRAVAYETGAGPRCECTMVDTATVGCYMYRPTRPYTVKPQAYERTLRVKRPVFGPAIIAARVQPVRVAECSYIQRSGHRSEATAYAVPTLISAKRDSRRCKSAKKSARSRRISVGIRPNPASLQETGEI